MTDLYILDSGPLGLISNPKESADSRAFKAWVKATLASGARVVIPAVIDYEIRRELLRAGKARGVARLDMVAANQGTLPVTDRVWNRAAELWAEARKAGKQTAGDAALDIDMILAATALVAAEDGSSVVVVTGNPGHLGRFVDARDWRAI